MPGMFDTCLPAPGIRCHVVMHVTVLYENRLGGDVSPYRFNLALAIKIGFKFNLWARVLLCVCGCFEWEKVSVWLTGQSKSI